MDSILSVTDSVIRSYANKLDAYLFVVYKNVTLYDVIDLKTLL